MKRLLYLTFALGLLIPALPSSLQAAQHNEEQHLIGILQSNQSAVEKDAACAQLKRIGTARSIPALAALLEDEQLSHSARYALESMPYAKAGQALTDALGKTSGTDESRHHQLPRFPARDASGAGPGQVADGSRRPGGVGGRHGAGADRRLQSP